jgi:hypothetical protein
MSKSEFFQALAENEGITDLILDFSHVPERIWTALWQSVSRHPKLKRIFLPRRRDSLISRIFMNEAQRAAIRARQTAESNAQRTRRTQAMEALRINTVLLDITLYREKFNSFLLDSDVYPRLLVNNYRPHVVAIAKEKGEWRRKLLVQALASVAGQHDLI